jgi:hypothetical protein
MSRKDELIALAERVEALTGPDRMVAKLIFAAVYSDGVPSPVVESGYGWREDDAGWWLATGEDARTPPKTVYPPNWLASLDAAMSLVPEGWVSVRGWDYRNRASRAIFMDDEGVRLFWGRAATPALAMTAAALRAIAETQEQQP